MLETIMVIGVVVLGGVCAASLWVVCSCLRDAKAMQIRFMETTQNMVEMLGTVKAAEVDPRTAQLSQMVNVERQRAERERALDIKKAVQAADTPKETRQVIRSIPVDLVALEGMRMQGTLREQQGVIDDASTPT